MKKSSSAPCPLNKRGASARRLFALGLFASYIVLMGCPSTPKALTSARPGFEIRQVGAQPPLPLLPGDWVIEGPQLAVTLAGSAHARDERGAISSLAETAESTGVPLAIRPVLRARGRLVALELESIHRVIRKGRPWLSLLWRGSNGDGISGISKEIHVQQELALSDVKGALRVSLSVLSESMQGRDFGVGLRVGWGGGPPLLAGEGVLTDKRWHRVSVAMKASTGHDVALGVKGGHLAIQGAFERHGDTEYLHHTDVWAERSDGMPMTQATYYVTRSSKSIADAVRHLGWTRGEPFAELTVQTDDSPEQTFLRLETQNGRPVIETRVTEPGTTILPIPATAAALRLLATARGHASSDPITLSYAEGRVVPSTVRVAVPRGAKVRLQVRDGDGAPIPFRARFRGLNVQSPMLGDEHHAAGAGDTVYELRGTVEVPLGPGKYRVTVSHGPEWSIAEQTFEVTQTFRPDVQVQLVHEVSLADWVPSDFHMHAEPSDDSEVPIVDRIVTLAAEGIRFAVPTDHNRVTDYAATRDAMQWTELGTVPGIEVTTWEPNFGHFTAYPMPLRVGEEGQGAPLWSGRTPTELFAELHARSPETLVQVNHPRLEGEIGYFDQMSFDAASNTGSPDYSPNYDVLEVWNSFDLKRPAKFRRVFRDWLSLLEHGHRVTAVGTSDSHFVRGQWVGYPRTYVYVPEFDAAAPLPLLAALKSGLAFVTNGPLLDVDIGGARPGESLTRSDSDRLRIRVQSPGWMSVETVEIWTSATDHRELSLPVKRRRRTSQDVSTEIPADARFVVVLVRGTRSMEALLGSPQITPMAFSNPIWIEQEPREQQAPQPPQGQPNDNEPAALQQ